MANSFVTSRRVEFRDTDTAGIAHFSVFFVWMEQAEHAVSRLREEVSRRLQPAVG